MTDVNIEEATVDQLISELAKRFSSCVVMGVLTQEDGDFFRMKLSGSETTALGVVERGRRLLIRDMMEQEEADDDEDE